MAEEPAEALHFPAPASVRNFLQTYSLYSIRFVQSTAIAMQRAVEIPAGLLQHMQKCLRKDQTFVQPFFPEPCPRAEPYNRHRSMLLYAGSTAVHQTIRFLYRGTLLPPMNDQSTHSTSPKSNWRSELSEVSNLPSAETPFTTVVKILPSFFSTTGLFSWYRFLL